MSATFEGEPLPSDLLVSSAFEEASDVFAVVTIKVDQTKNVKPIATAAAVVIDSSDFTAGKKPFKTLQKYSYAESGKTLIKVLLPELDKLNDHPADKLRIDF